MIAVADRAKTSLAVWSLRRDVTVRVAPIAAPLWHGGDVAAALNMVDVVADAFVHLPGWDLVPFLSTEQVQKLVAHDEQLLGQVEWIASCIAAAHAPRPIASTRRAPAPEPLVDDSADTWSVAAAALILSRDPAIDVGRETLIAFLRDLGWVHRENGVYVPAAHTLDAGSLHHNRTWNPRTKVAYNQVRITRTGLQILHERLGGYATLSLEPTSNPTLLEV